MGLLKAYNNREREEGKDYEEKRLKTFKFDNQGGGVVSVIYFCKTNHLKVSGLKNNEHLFMPDSWFSEVELLWETASSSGSR